MIWLWMMVSIGKIVIYLYQWNMWKHCGVSGRDPWKLWKEIICVHGKCGDTGKGGSYSEMNLFQFGEIVSFFRLIGCGIGQFQPILSRSRFY